VQPAKEKRFRRILVQPFKRRIHFTARAIKPEFVAGGFIGATGVHCTANSALESIRWNFILKKIPQTSVASQVKHDRSPALPPVRSPAASRRTPRLPSASLTLARVNLLIVAQKLIQRRRITAISNSPRIEKYGFVSIFVLRKQWLQASAGNLSSGSPAAIP